MHAAHRTHVIWRLPRPCLANPFVFTNSLPGPLPLQEDFDESVNTNVEDFDMTVSMSAFVGRLLGHASIVPLNPLTEH